MSVECLDMGDPSLGVRKVTHEDFNSIWNNIFFVIRNQTDLGRQNFERDNRWAGRRQMLFDTALSNQALSSFRIHTAIAPGIFQYGIFIHELFF